LPAPEDSAYILRRVFPAYAAALAPYSCIDQHNRPVINISADTWTVQLRFPDELQAFGGANT